MVVYLIHEDGKIKIPFSENDTALLRQLTRLGAGFWDRGSRQFVLPGNAPLVFRSVERVLVETFADPAIPIRVDGFFSRPPAIRQTRIPDTVNAASPQQQQNYFSDTWQERLETELHARKYSFKTVKAYRYYNQNCCQTLQKTPDNIESSDIKAYLAYLNSARDFSASSMNLALSALKFFYHTVLQKNNVREQRRPRHDKRLPVVLAKSEITRLLGAAQNPKHRLLLMLVYSSGLRVSEVVALKREHIDFARKAVYIHAGKGRKDRATLLSDIAAQALQNYYALIPAGPGTWLFPGIPDSAHLSIRSAQKIFETNLAKAHIGKGATIHSLRHSFATHLLESGTDVRFIQDLLGHQSIKTTERYTHVAKRNALKIPSPLDTPDEGENLQDVQFAGTPLQFWQTR
jgi:site-specific recombinase XerD